MWEDPWDLQPCHLLSCSLRPEEARQEVTRLEKLASKIREDLKKNSIAIGQVTVMMPIFIRNVLRTPKLTQTGQVCTFYMPGKAHRTPGTQLGPIKMIN